MSFVHLHVHSEYSLLDGLSRIPRLVKRAAEMGMPALALTDHGAMFGVIEFYRAAKGAGIKPIIGMESYMAPRRMTDRDPQLDGRAFHLLLLAENQAGYRNLLQIASASQLDGFYYRPRIDHEFLASHSEGLICTTGCLSGEVPRALIEGKNEKARSLLDWHFEVFGPEHFFIELQQHNIPELPAVNRALTELAPRYQARLVATNDVHYIEPEDADLQDILLCVQTGAVRADPDRMRMTDASYYLRSPEEMRGLFSEFPSAISNTLEIAERCELDLDFKGYHLPNFEVPAGQTPQSYLERLCRSGLEKRFGPRAEDPAIQQRLTQELAIIHEMGFDTYFLIVWDLCRYAREESIWYNARGSAAGSIVAYCLGITLVDPLEHGLIFERFLNPGRVSMPDIDLDFQDDLRYRLLEYTANRYGKDKVAQIITFGTLGARAAVRDVGRVLDIPLPEVDRVAKAIPNIPGKPVSIPEALESVAAFKEAYEQAPYLRELIDTAAKLEGVARNAGTHAAGVIITDRPIIEYVPLHRPTKGAAEDSPVGAVTQFEMQILESLGLLKVDFLGLSTLTVMARACTMIKQRRQVELDIHSIPLDDPATFDLLGRGDVLGVFQVEGAGMRRYLMDMKPQSLSHVIAMVALYRPGPMEFIPAYIRRMHGEEPVSYRHPALEAILKETYGITVYQEQIMYTAMNLAGYSASEADNLRKAVAKKKAQKLHQERDRFVTKAVERGIPRAAAEAIFDDWEAFARYGFPKGHAADYAVICVQTAYLKAHYPAEYMTALLSVYKGDTDRVALYIADCRRMGFEVLPPDINTSSLDFEIQDRPDGEPSIRFGLGAIKNVGEGPVGAILAARNDRGPFASPDDFARRVDLRAVGKRALECLARVGALDSLGSRASLLESLDRIIAYSSAYFRAREVGQLSLFGTATGVTETLSLSDVITPISRRQQLHWERELLGVYVTEHPLTPHMESLTQIVSHFSGELPEAPHGQPVCVAGEVTHIRPYQTRSGRAMGFVTLEDVQGSIELVVFSRAWSDIASWLAEGMIVVAKGKIDAERGDPKVLVDELSRDLAMTQAIEASRISPAPSILDLDEFAGPPEANGFGPDAESMEAPVELRTEYPPQEPILPSADRLEQRAPTVSGTEASGASLQPGVPAGDSLVPIEALGSSSAIPGEAGFRAWEVGSEARMINLILRSTGDKKRDALRMRRIHGLLNSYPGKDHFAFDIYESSRRYYLEFPNSTTGYCPELHAQLLNLLGEGSIRVQLLRIQ